MHSSDTFGDPMTVVSNRSPSNQVEPHAASNTNHYIHTFKTDMSKTAGNSVTLINASITHELHIRDQELTTTAQTVRVEKRIVHDPPGHTHTYDIAYTDSRVQTSVTNSELAVAAENGGLRKLWTAQGKRLGDHEQIIFAKWLARGCGNFAHTKVDRSITRVWQEGAGVGSVADWPTTLDPAAYHPGGVWDEYNTISQQDRDQVDDPLAPPYILNCDTENVFFVTGDWPCFCYSVYNRVNSILMINSDWIVAKF